MPKYGKFNKYAKPKIFMSTTSKRCQIFLIWHKNMPVGNTVREGWAVLTRQRKNETVELLRNNSIVHAVRQEVG